MKVEGRRVSGPEGAATMTRLETLRRPGAGRAGGAPDDWRQARPSPPWTLADALAVQPYPAPAADAGPGPHPQCDGLDDDRRRHRHGHRRAASTRARSLPVGPDLRAGAGALVIDATGRHVTPGIVDAHSHSATEQLDLNEGVNSISSEVRVRDVLDARSPPDLPAARRRGHGGPRPARLRQHHRRPERDHQVPLGRRAPGRPGVRWQRRRPSSSPSARTRPRRPSRRMPGADLRYPATRMGVSALIRSSFEAGRRLPEGVAALPVRCRSASRPARPPPRRDLRLEPLVEILQGKRAVHAHSYRADEILMLMRLAGGSGLQVTTFQHVARGLPGRRRDWRPTAPAPRPSPTGGASRAEAFEAIP